MKRQQKLGHGANGQVYLLSTYRGNKKAVKKIPVPDYDFIFIQQALIMQKLSRILPDSIYRRYIPELYQYQIKDPNKYMIMQYLENYVTLKEYLESDYLLSMKPGTVYFIMLQLLEFMSLMHNEYGIAHGDFHEGNIMISLTDASVKIIDFANAKFSKSKTDSYSYFVKEDRLNLSINLCQLLNYKNALLPFGFSKDLDFDDIKIIKRVLCIFVGLHLVDIDFNWDKKNLSTFKKFATFWDHYNFVQQLESFVDASKGLKNVIGNVFQ